MDALRGMLASAPYPTGEAALLGMEELPAARMIYCTALPDAETFMQLSAFAAHCRVMVFCISYEEHPALPQDTCFECYPVYVPQDADGEV